MTLALDAHEGRLYGIFKPTLPLAKADSGSTKAGANNILPYTGKNYFSTVLWKPKNLNCFEYSIF
jgi:hypothetical protein